MSFPIDAILPVAASILTLIFSQSHSRKIADDDRAERARQANNDRSVQVKENRYADRRDAVIDLIAAAEDEANRITDFERENMYGAESPGDIMTTTRFRL